MRPTGIAILSAVALLASPLYAEPASPIDVAPLPLWRSMIAAARADARNRDEFATAKLPAIYRDNIEIHHKRPLVDKGSKNYSYKDGVLTLYAAALLTLSDKFGGMPTLTLTSDKRYGDEYSASNAYGASVEVTNWRREDDGLLILAAPSQGLEQPRYLPVVFYEHKIVMSGEAAKALVANVDVYIDAIISRPPSGKPVVCERSSSTATINDPESSTIDGCYVGAKITHISLVDRTSSLSLKDWK